MIQVLVVIHLLVAVSLVGVILLQKSEGGGLGIGGGGGMSGFMTGRGTANLLTRTTAILATVFFLSSLALAWLVSTPRQSTSILDNPAGTAAPAPASTPTVPPADTGGTPATPATGTQSAPAPAAPPAESQAPAAPASSTTAPAAPAPAPSEPAKPAEPSVPVGQ